MNKRIKHLFNTLKMQLISALMIVIINYYVNYLCKCDHFVKRVQLQNYSEAIILLCQLLLCDRVMDGQLAVRCTALMQRQQNSPVSSTQQVLSAASCCCYATMLLYWFLLLMLACRPALQTISSEQFSAACRILQTAAVINCVNYVS